ncbi:MAG: porin family protein [Bernardetiaceae bacterium]
MKRFLLTIAWMLFSCVLLAQSNLRLGLNFNPTISFARLTDEDKNVLDYVDNNARLGFSGGLLLDYDFAERVGFRTGLQIVQKGYKFSGFNDAVAKVGFTTIEIPLALKMRSGELAEGLHLRGLFGLQMGINVGAVTTTELPNGDKLTNRKMDNYNTFTPDFLVGLGLEFDAAEIGKIDVGLSYHHGLARITKSDIGFRALMNYFSLDLGFFF